MSGISWNEDWMQYFGFLGDEFMDEAHLRAWVRQYADTQIKELFFNPNGMRVSYPCAAREYIADGYDPALSDDDRFFSALEHPPWKTLGHREFPHHLWMLEKKGLNPYEIWTDECRKRGLSPWFSMRMNDVHGVEDPSYYFHSAFWRDHPEYRCAEYRFANGRSSLDRALDYAHPAVRAHQYALIDEYLTHFDLDGLELDFLRFPAFFRPGFQEQGIPVMDEFVREVRARLDKMPFGHRVALSVRVPLRPEVALGLGLDVINWARRGWIDRVTPMQSYHGYFGCAPYELWARILEGMGVMLCGGLDIGVTPEPGKLAGKTTLETTRACCCSMLQKGVARVYLFNHMYKYSEIAEYGALIREVGALETIIGKPRRHIWGCMDFSMPGEAAGNLLPMALRPNVVRDARMHLGRLANETAHVILAGQTEADAPAVRLNGVACARTECPPMCSPAPEACWTRWRYAVPARVAHDGYNNLEITSDAAAEIHWIEIGLT